MHLQFLSSQQEKKILVRVEIYLMYAVEKLMVLSHLQKYFLNISGKC